MDQFIRFSGWALLIGGALATIGWILFSILDPRHVNTTVPTYPILNLIVILGGVFMAMGLPGFYLSMSGRTGAWSWAGLVILFFGIAIPYIAVQSVETAAAPNRPPFMDLLVSIGAPTLFVGSLLTAIVIYSSGVYPRWIAVALVIAILLGLLAQVVRFPPVLSRGGLFSAFYSLIIAILGYLTLNQSSS
jgi:hypothetical protein